MDIIYSKELKKKWSSYILRSFRLGEILTWTEIKKRAELIAKSEFPEAILISDSVLGKYLKKLVSLKLIKKHGKQGYSIQRSKYLDYVIFKEKDKEKIDVSEVLYRLVFPFETLDANCRARMIAEEYKGKSERISEKDIKKRIVHQTINESPSINSRFLTIYGENKISDLSIKISKVVKNTIKELYDLSKREYEAQFKKMVFQECKKIKDKNVVKCIRNWSQEVTNNTMILLSPERYSRELKKLPFNTTPKRDGLSNVQFSKVQKITIKIMNDLNKNYPPMMIVMHL